MRVLVCGNKAEHRWPEACVRNLRAMGHEAELLYYRELQERDLECYIPRTDWPKLRTVLQTAAARTQLMEALFDVLTTDFRPELILLAGMYHTWSAEILAKVKDKTGAAVVLWSGDDPYVPGATDIFTPGRFYDRALFTIYGLAERAAGDLPHTGFLPFACDPEVDFVPAVEPEERLRFRSAVSYLGTLKLDRADVLEALARSGLGLRVWGPGLADDVVRTHPRLAGAFRPERVQGELARVLYGASEVVLNLHHQGFGNMKFYEVASCGVFQISNLRRDAEAIQAELPFMAHAVATETTDELIETVRNYLQDPEAREANALALQAIVRGQHTWKHRLDAIIRDVCPAAAPLR